MDLVNIYFNDDILNSVFKTRKNKEIREIFTQLENETYLSAFARHKKRCKSSNTRRT